MEAHFSHEQLREAIKHSGLGVWQWDIKTDCVNWTLEMGLLFCVPEASFPQTVAEYSSLLHPEDREPVRLTIESAIASGKELFEIEHRVIKPDGTIRWIGGKGRLELDDAGHPMRLTGTARDITERKLAEQQADRFRLFSELASDYVYVAEVREGHPLTPSIVAGSFERATGYTMDQVAAKGGWPAIIHADDLASMGSVFAGMAEGRPMVAEYRILGPDGEIRWLRDHLRPELKDGVLVRILGGVQDITEQHFLEEKLGHAQRMEALARLAGSVAHDFNNLLMVISSSVELMQPTLAHSPDAISLSEDIRIACRRASELTRTLLTFGRKVPTQAQVVSLHETVKQWMAILERAAGEQVKLEYVWSDSALRVEVDTAQLQLALLNMTINARDAMPQGGRLLIQVRPGSEEDGRLDELGSRDIVVIEFKDTGTGIPADILARVFEPFFTTKGPTEGSGLGLSTCHGIVTQAGGTIRVTSQLGVGTTFAIYLPATTRSVAHSASAPVRGAVGGTESVLLLEDEPTVRRLARRILENHGYRVTTAEDLLQATLAMENQDFDLLVSDIRLPDGNGAEFADALRRQKPTQPIVLISGFAEGDAVSIIDRNQFPLLHKPFSADAFVRIIRDTLDRTRVRSIQPK